MVTKTRRQRNALIRRGYFMTEVRAWSQFDWDQTPWWPRLKAERTNLVKRWAKETGHRLSLVTPDQIRRSGTYQRMVREWYASHGWTGTRMSKGRTLMVIDPYAAMRFFADEYQRAPERADDPYKPAWAQRQIDRRARESAIDKRFSTEQGLEAA